MGRAQQHHSSSHKPKVERDPSTLSWSTFIQRLIGFALVCGIIVALVIPAIWVGRYAIIGWDKCSRVQDAPMLVQCVPGVGDEADWSKCTAREAGFGINELNQWRSDIRSCRITLQADPVEEPEAQALEVAQVEE